MTTTKSPGAVAALGAYETNLLGSKIVSNGILTRSCPQAIRAELIGSDTITALGFNARGSAPVLALCRELIAAGIDPATSLEAWRGNVLALRIASIDSAARLAVDETRTAFARWKAFPRAAVSPRIAQKQRAATTLAGNAR
jgi:hypothetical protein